MKRQPNAYSIGREKIAAALNDLLLPLRDGRSFRRYTHGWDNRIGTRRYYIGYTWMRPRANPLFGIVHDVILAYGDDFDSALAAAVAKLRKTAP